MRPSRAGVLAAKLLSVALVGLAAAQAATPGRQPEPPRVLIDTGAAFAAARTVAVRAGGDLQAALDRAQPGDVIALEEGATFVGPFTLPRTQADGWITIRTSAADDRLPAPGVRVEPAYARVMPKLEAARGSVIVAAPGAHHYRFVGVEIRPRPGVALVNLVQLGGNEPAVDLLPSHVIFDRCYLHGDPARGTRRGIALNSRYTAVVNSHLSDFKEVGVDSQALAAWGGPGPFKIVNNYLEAAGENVLFGGADPAITNLVPSDIEFRHNHVSKPVAWKADDPGFQGVAWTIKNLFELKNARRVLVDGNVFEQNWAHAQRGFAILFTVRNDGGRAPWSVVEDVTFTNNVVRRVGGGFNILGRDNNYPSAPTGRIRIANNLFEEVGGPRWPGTGTLAQMIEGAADVTIEHNTALQAGPIIVAEGAPHRDFTFRDNIVMHNAAGIAGTGTGVGKGALATFFPGALVRRNVMVGGWANAYPPDNFFPAEVNDIGFTDRAEGRYGLAARSPYRRAATDGRDIGVDVDALTAALEGLGHRTLHAFGAEPGR